MNDKGGGGGEREQSAKWKMHLKTGFRHYGTVTRHREGTRKEVQKKQPPPEKETFTTREVECVQGTVNSRENIWRGNSHYEVRDRGNSDNQVRVRGNSHNQVRDRGNSHN